MANSLKFGNGKWATNTNTVLAYNDENENFKPLPFNFERASSATVVNKNGLIETVGSGEPRIDFKDNTKGALILEPTRSNSLNFSEPTSSETIATGITYESFNWNLGFTNCIKFGDNSQTRYRYFTGSIANSTEYTISAFVIMDDLSEPVLGTGSDTGDLIFRVGGQSATTGNLPNVNMGNNIYRLSSVITSASGGGTTGLLKYSNQSNKGFRIVGFQLEEGSYATSYIPTSGSAVTRVADVCNDGGNAQVFNYSEGTFFIKVKYIDDTTSFRISLSDNTNNNKIILATLNGFYYYEVRAVDASVSASIFSNITQTTNDVLLAGTWKQNQFKFFVNGIKIAEDTLGNVPTNLYTVRFNNLSTNQPFFGNCRDLRVYNTVLTDQELIALTTI
jgi:hypothetical protein